MTQNEQVEILFERLKYLKKDEEKNKELIEMLFDIVSDLDLYKPFMNKLFNS